MTGSGRSKRTALVVGGGLAGLSAALHLADRGWRVRLFEKRAILGGRAYSYRAREAGHAVDNGQHLLIGCYDRTLSFLERIGTRHAVEMQPRMWVPLSDAERGRAPFGCARLPSPLHLTVGALRYRHLEPRERLRLLAGGMAFVLRSLRGKGLEGRTVAEVFGELRQGSRLRRAFWDPLAIAVLNELPERASALLFGEVLRRVFLAPASASSLVFPRVGLSDLFATPAARAIEERGGEVVVGMGARTIELANGRARGLRFDDGRVFEGDAVVLAVPPPALSGLLPEPLRRASPFERAALLSSSPIVSVHLWLAERVETPRMLGFLDGPLQWLFTPPMQPDEGRYVTLVASGARGLAAASPDDVLAEARSVLARHVPQALASPWLDALVTKEREATFAAAPQEQRARPGTATPIPNLFLAGDWTDTGLPATLESAILSGERAAAQIGDVPAVCHRLSPFRDTPP